VNIDQTAKQVQLASKFIVGNYLDAVDAHNGQAIADAIHRRFVERYLQPASNATGPGRGFAMMAIACVMIEALESFRRGWPDTRGPGRGEHAFCSFFDAHTAYATLRGHARDFMFAGFVLIHVNSETFRATASSTTIISTQPPPTKRELRASF
jgi:hypothetical protein